MSQQAGGITEFLNELSETDGLSALREAYNRNSPLVFKIEESPQPIKLTIGTFADKKIIVMPDPADIDLPLNKEVSIKFLVGTEVFFMKTMFKAFQNRFYIDMNTKVIQLKRRREPRFIIPKAWNQSGQIILTKQHESIKCNVLDISKSGVRFEILDKVKLDFQRNDIIKIKFQVHKRAEVASSAIVRFILHRTNMNSILGLELAEITDVQNERVSSIVSDIQLFISTQKS